MGTDWFGAFWAAVWASDIKWTDVAIVTFTLGQVWVGLRQAKIAKQQALIADETRYIAIAALGRPYVFFEFVLHNTDEWRDGIEPLSFTFRFTNHGNGPAVVEAIHAKTMLIHNNSDMSDDAKFLTRMKLISPFPPKDASYLRHITWNAQVLYAPTTPEAEPQHWENGSVLILRSGETSRVFQATLSISPLRHRDEAPEHSVFARADRSLYELTKLTGPVDPWLFGSITYQSPMGSQYWTHFCVCAAMDGTSFSWDEAPYTQRT